MYPYHREDRDDPLLWIKKCDIYRNISHSLGEQTVAGGIATIIAFLISIYLFLSEFALFMDIETFSRTYVDRDVEGLNVLSPSMDMNIDITLHSVPCFSKFFQYKLFVTKLCILKKVLSLDVQDVMGNHIVNLKGKVRKLRVDSKFGAVEFDYQIIMTPEEVKKQAGEGCRIAGSVPVKKVPGNMHLSAHGNKELLRKFVDENWNLNMSHTIHRLSFGPNAPNIAKSDHSFNSLEESKRIITNQLLQSLGMPGYPSFEYYIKIVPTIVETVSGDKIKTYQYVSNSNLVDYKIPGIYLRFDLTPITIELTERKKSLAHFFVQISAILGGVITMLGIISSFVHTSIHTVIAKARSGKLG